MHRPNPGPFEPIVYFIRTPMSFRIIGVGGFALFAVCFLTIAARRGAMYAAVGLAMLAAFWLESSLTVCRRCRFYGTWHCVGQGMVVARLFARRPPGTSDARLMLHAALGIALTVYGFFWIWHSPLLGVIFTLWLPLGILSAFPSGGFSWLSPSAFPKAA